MLAEEITRDIIQEIVLETIKNSSPAPDPSWVAIVGVFISILVLAFSIFKFGQNQKQQSTEQITAQNQFNTIQKQHNEKQEEAQRQFNETQKKTKNLEFVQHLEVF